MPCSASWAEISPPEAGGLGRLVDDDAAPGLGDRVDDGLRIQWLQRHHVDNFGRDAILGECLGDGEGLLHHRAPGHQRHVGALAQHVADVQWRGAPVVGDFLLDGAVEPGWLEEDYRVGITDRRQHQSVGARRRRRDEDAEPRHVSEHGFDALRMVLGCVYAGAHGRADHQRAGDAPPRPVPEPTRVVHDLVHGWVYKAEELDLGDQAHSLRRHADGHPADQSFREWCIQNTLRPEARLKSVGGAEHAAVGADVLADYHHIRIFLERAGKGHGDGADQGNLSHVRLLRSSRAGGRAGRARSRIANRRSPWVVAAASRGSPRRRARWFPERR